MAKLKSTIKVLYDARDNKFGKVVFEMGKKEQVGENYIIPITDYIAKEIITPVENGEPIISESLEFWRTKNVSIPVEIVDNLYTQISAAIPHTIPYTERQKKIEQIAFYQYVINDFIKDDSGNVMEALIYGLLPNEIEMVEE